VRTTDEGDKVFVSGVSFTGLPGEQFQGGSGAEYGGGGGGGYYGGGGGGSSPGVVGAGGGGSCFALEEDDLVGCNCWLVLLYRH
jgi:hypothetical protein